jgi:adenosylcobinamide-phosphate synthase
MAVILNTALSGPRAYHGEMRDYPWVWAEGRRNPGPAEIDAACAALWRAWAAMFALTALIAII